MAPTLAHHNVLPIPGEAFHWAAKPWSHAVAGEGVQGSRVMEFVARLLEIKINLVSDFVEDTCQLLLQFGFQHCCAGSAFSCESM